MKTAEFLLCNGCGVYVGAFLRIAEGSYATLNVNTLERHADFARPAESVNYDSEDAAGRTARRMARWTPASVIVGGELF